MVSLHSLFELKERNSSVFAVVSTVLRGGALRTPREQRPIRASEERILMNWNSLGCNAISIHSSPNHTAFLHLRHYATCDTRRPSNRAKSGRIEERVRLANLVGEELSALGPTIAEGLASIPGAYAIQEAVFSFSSHLRRLVFCAVRSEPDLLSERGEEREERRRCWAQLRAGRVAEERVAAREGNRSDLSAQERGWPRGHDSGVAEQRENRPRDSWHRLSAASPREEAQKERCKIQVAPWFSTAPNRDEMEATPATKPSQLRETLDKVKTKLPPTIANSVTAFEQHATTLAASVATTGAQQLQALRQNHRIKSLKTSFSTDQFLQQAFSLRNDTQVALNISLNVSPLAP